MSILGSIVSKIFHEAEAVLGHPQAAAAQPTTTQPAATPVQADTAAATQAVAAPAQGSAAPQQPVDVEAVMTNLEAKSGQKLNWRTSIVDMMKLLNLDSSLEARKELAKELNYSGDTSDSAAMNVWLHKEVMQKLAENGGQVPADLKAA